MKEDLFVVKDGIEYRLDLPSPSGITITYNSNLFNDLSKIDSSKSYTFAIPNTANNSGVFDLVEEVAHNSSMFGKRMACRYFYNGIEICKNANLYISEIDEKGEYKAVMTWDVVQGLIDMKDNDISLRSLEDYTKTAEYGVGTINRDRFKLANFISSNEVVYPYYSAGIAFDMDATTDASRNKLYPMCPPAVPVYMLLKKIEDKFGLTFNFKEPYDWQELYDDVRNNKVDYIKQGVLPLVKTEVSDTLQEKGSRCGVSAINFANYGTLYGVDNVLSFAGGSSYGTDIERDVSRGYCGFKINIPMMSVRIDGYIRLGFSSGTFTDDVPKLIFSSARVPKTASDPVIFDDEDPEEKASVEGEFDGVEDGLLMYLFDFRSTMGMSNVLCENLKAYDFYKRVLVISTNYPVNTSCNATANFIVFPYYDEGVIGHKCDIYRNLPNISCLSFLKSLFYIVGGFPRVESDGSISISYFKDLKDNVESGNVIDWSGKYIGHHETKHKTTFTNGNLAVENYYLMANDKLDEEDDSSKDLYAHSFGVLACKNYTLDRRKTICQMPYYGKFIRNAKSYRISTGYTIKYFEKDKGVISAKEAQPAFGILSEHTFGADEILTMSVWQFPSEMTDDVSYSYLQKIVEKPYILELDMNLSELDLMEVDYRKPVYIQKYNLYFAIVKIQFSSSSGKSKVTLIKLPNT